LILVEQKRIKTWIENEWHFRQTKKDKNINKKFLLIELNQRIKKTQNKELLIEHTHDLNKLLRTWALEEKWCQNQT
jgi:hypothetical protein